MLLHKTTNCNAQNYTKLQTVIHKTTLNYIQNYMHILYNTHNLSHTQTGHIGVATYNPCCTYLNFKA